MTGDLGAQQAAGLSQAEPVSRLGPPGFDPSRWEGRVLVRCMGGSFCKHTAGQCTADPEFQRYIHWQRQQSKPDYVPPHKLPVWLSSVDVLEAIQMLAERSTDKAACWDFTQAVYALADRANAIAMEARSVETEGLHPQDDSADPKGIAPEKAS